MAVRQFSRFLNDTLSLFKGQLSLHDIMYGLPMKRLLELRETRKEELIEQQKELEKMQSEKQSNDIRQSILAPP